MSRREFTVKTKEDAWERSGGLCEADGALYGLPADSRCSADMRRVGVRYDHIDPDANSKDNSLENCCACCPRCHDWKTRNIDMPRLADTVRQQKRAHGIKVRKGQPLAGTVASGWRKPMFGPPERR
jgi:hypothetical protein